MEGEQAVQCHVPQLATGNWQRGEGAAGSGMTAHGCATSPWPEPRASAPPRPCAAIPGCRLPSWPVETSSSPSLAGARQARGVFRGGQRSPQPQLRLARSYYATATQKQAQRGGGARATRGSIRGQGGAAGDAPVRERGVRSALAVPLVIACTALSSRTFLMRPACCARVSMKDSASASLSMSSERRSDTCDWSVVMNTDGAARGHGGRRAAGGGRAVLRARRAAARVTSA